jgi:hypothetical protein
MGTESSTALVGRSHNLELARRASNTALVGYVASFACMGRACSLTCSYADTAASMLACFSSARSPADSVFDYVSV